METHRPRKQKKKTIWCQERSRGRQLLFLAAINMFGRLPCMPPVDVQVVAAGLDHREFADVGAEQLKRSVGRWVAGRGGEGLSETGEQCVVGNANRQAGDSRIAVRDLLIGGRAVQ